jgi:thiamine biosynthesis lipoprotein
MAAVDASLSRFRRDSELSRLNAAAGSAMPRAVDPRLRRMLVLARRAQRETDGRFDPRTLEALEGLGERASVRYVPADRPSLFADTAWLYRTGRHLLTVNAPVDSGGIGKGLGLRWALAAARRQVPDAQGLLLEAGGDIAALGMPADGDAWRIGIEDPDGDAEPLAVVVLGSGALATSSVAVRAWTGPDGRQAHHLIDPRTWRPADTGLRAVSVSWSDPAWAEIWSKALFLAGSSGIGPEARARGMAVWWVEEDGSFHLTPAASEMTLWRRDG